MTEKSEMHRRHKAIKELVKTREISDQKQLVELLLRHHNIESNQAVASRDLRKLEIVKKNGKSGLVYTLPDMDVDAEILKLALVDITYNESLIVIKTHPALADFVGDCIDEHSDLGVLGCVSGENTVFVAPQSTKNIRKSYETICKRLGFKIGGKKHG
ncbi:MAG: Arginine repressor [Chlamydiales bacterium]|nr:Arginine repressor [Chlamydiales bacterium]